MDMVQVFIDIGETAQAQGLFNKLPDKDKNSDMGKSLLGQLSFAELAAKTEGINTLTTRLADNADDHDARFDLAVCRVAGHDWPDRSKCQLRVRFELGLAGRQTARALAMRVGVRLCITRSGAEPSDHSAPDWRCRTAGVVSPRDRPVAVAIRLPDNLPLRGGLQLRAIQHSVCGWGSRLLNRCPRAATLRESCRRIADLGTTAP